MHIPDGVLSPEVCAGAGAISLGVVGYSLKRLSDSLTDRAIPLTGMMSALIFAGQMVNFPIGLVGIPAVSGHLMGGVLAAAILGPWAGCVAITLVLFVQCLLFADGGISALGANILNMGVVGALGGYAVLSVVRKMAGGGLRGTLLGVIIAAWLSVVAAATLFCVEFQLSHLSSEFDLRNIFALMVTFHSAIGIGEALITGGVVSLVLLQRPDLIYQPAPQARGAEAATRIGGALAAGIVAALAIAAFLAPFASSYDDGLEAVGGRAFSSVMEQQPTVIVLDDYNVPLPIPRWEESEMWQKVSVSVAGIAGTLAVLVIAWLLDRSLKLRVATAGRNAD
ncbi:MAG: energy-coupling factor ABC transporter permease [Planctomycetaceae bacterium]